MGMFVAVVMIGVLWYIVYQERWFDGVSITMAVIVTMFLFFAGEGKYNNEDGSTYCDNHMCGSE
jgi:hypothetical protein